MDNDQIDFIAEGMTFALEDNHKRFVAATELDDHEKMIKFCELIGELHEQVIFAKDTLLACKKRTWRDRILRLKS